MKIAALGYYGFGNLGDEAVLAGIRAALKTEPVFDAATFTVLSNAPEETVRLHPGVVSANRWKWHEASAALVGTDLFVLGGGSLLQDTTSVKSVVWYALMARLARAKSRRLLWWGQGIGPLTSKLSRYMVGLIARQADAVTVRDEKSWELLKACGFTGSNEVVADPAFALAPENPATDAGGAVLVALRSWRENEWLTRVLSGTDDNLASVLHTATGTNRDRLHGFPMHYPGDAEMLFANCGITPSIDWREGTIAQAFGAVSRASLVIAMRLHALIFAARCAVPFVALSYDPKVDALAKACGQEDALLNVNDRTLTRETLLATIARVRDTDAVRRDTLREFAARQQTKAVRPAQIAANWFR